MSYPILIRLSGMNDELKEIVAGMSSGEKLALADEFEREALILRCEACERCGDEQLRTWPCPRHRWMEN